MASKQKFGMLRGILRTIGLSNEATDDAVNFISLLLSGESDKATPIYEHNTNNNNQSIKASEIEILPYHKRDNFLSPAELDFYKVLRNVVKNRLTITCKVNLRDIIWVQSSDQSIYRTYTNKIDRKHVDFLLCDVDTMQPVVAIELDDKSHNRKDRQERDVFVDKVFATADVPLIHIKVRRSYSENYLSDVLAPYTHQIKTEAKIKSSQTAPNCPECSGQMMLRKPTKGKNAGRQFWACSDYPICKTIIRMS